MDKVVGSTTFRAGRGRGVAGEVVAAGLAEGGIEAAFTLLEPCEGLHGGMDREQDEREEKKDREPMGDCDAGEDPACGTIFHAWTALILVPDAAGGRWGKEPPREAPCVGMMGEAELPSLAQLDGLGSGTIVNKSLIVFKMEIAVA